MNQIEGEGTSKLDRAERLALALVFLLVLAQLVWPPMVGVANNGDFERLMKWGGLAYVTPSYEEKYFGWINREFRFEQSPWRAWKGFRSSEAVFIKAAAIVGEVVFPGDRFDLRLLGLVHLLGFVAALALLFRGWKAATGRSALALVPGTLLFFCDIGYTAYFNSFYSEPAALIFLLAMMGAGLGLAADWRWDRLLLFCLCAGLFVAAKAQHVAFAPILLLLCARLYWRSTEKRERQVLAAFAFALVASPFLLQVFTPWYADSARYNSVFFGVLKDSATPEQDLIALGLDPKFAVLANTTAFDPHLPVDIQSPAFREAFFDRINPIRVPWFYLTHPDRGLEKLRISAANAFTLRPPYAGNFEKATGAPARAQTARWSAWSAFKQTCWPRSLWVLIGYWVLLLGGILWGYRRATPRSKRLWEWMLAGWSMMIAAFATPILGDGESDLARHLFAFNAFFDLSLLFLTGGLMGLIGRLRPLIRCTPLPMSS